MADPKGIRVEGLLTLGMVAVIPPDLGTGVIDIKDLHAKAEADAILRDIPTRAQTEPCQGCAELGKECLEHQRRRNTLAHQQSCMLCVTGSPCYTHKPITNTADIWKSGFDALTVRVQQLKGDLTLAEMDNQLLRNQRDHHEREAKRLQSALDYANERIKKFESNR